MNFITKYKKLILIVLAVLGAAASLTVTGVDDKLVTLATDYVNSVSVEVSPTIVVQ